MEVTEIAENERGGFGSEVDEEKWVYDSSVDHKGRIPLRASTGVWKASLFIIGMEFAERLSYYGICTNLITYLTKFLQEDLQTAAKNVNYWAGVTTMAPLIGGFMADGYIGRFRMVLVSSVIYILGQILLMMSQYIPSIKACNTNMCSKSPEVHKVVFFVAIYLISVGSGGHKPSLESFGADQFDDGHLKEAKKKLSFFNWWNLTLSAGVIFGVTVIVYVEDNVGWGAADIILTLVMSVSIVIFLLGMPYYRYTTPKGSTYMSVLQVLAAAIAKRNLPYPPSPSKLYEMPKSQRAGKRLLHHTNKFRFLDKAAIVEAQTDIENLSAEKQSQWILATVTKVEEVKLLLNIVPIWLCTLTFGICISQITTFFIKQGSTMNRRLTHNFVIPPATLYTFTTLTMMITIAVYDKLLIPTLRRATGNIRGISILQRIGIGLVFNMLAMVVAATVERKRLNIADREKTEVLSSTVFWLAPQCIFLGIGDGFTLVGLQEYFYSQVPDSMRSLGIALYLSVVGVASFLSSFLITTVDHVTEKAGRGSWFGKHLNESRLDYFYWLLAAMAGLNLCFYVYVARRYSYKNVEKVVGIPDSYHLPEVHA